MHGLADTSKKGSSESLLALFTAVSPGSLIGLTHIGLAHGAVQVVGAANWQFEIGPLDPGRVQEIVCPPPVRLTVWPPWAFQMPSLWVCPATAVTGYLVFWK
jgi:hypothetical protein